MLNFCATRPLSDELDRTSQSSMAPCSHQPAFYAQNVHLPAKFFDLWRQICPCTAEDGAVQPHSIGRSQSPWGYCSKPSLLRGDTPASSCHNWIGGIRTSQADVEIHRTSYNIYNRYNRYITDIHQISTDAILSQGWSCAGSRDA